MVSYERNEMPKIVRKHEKKRSIAIAAIDLIAENGLAQTSVESIAMAANVGKGTVYLYFKTKEEIIIEIWDYVCSLLNAHRVEKFKTAQSVYEKIAIFYDFSVLKEKNILDKLLKIYANNISIVLTSTHTALQENFNKKTQEDIEAIKDILQEGIKKGELKNFDVDLISTIYEKIFKGTIINGICKGSSVDDLRQSLKKQREFLFELIKKD